MDKVAAARMRRPRLLERVRHAIRRKHCSYRTEMSYLHWVRRFILFHERRHPEEMGEAEVALCARHKRLIPCRPD